MIDLKSIITKYPECLENKSRFVAIVSDICNLPEDKVMIKILGDVLDCGIVEEIRNSDARIDAAKISRFRTMLEKKYGYSPRLCNAAVMQWVEALKEEKTTALEKSQKDSIDTSLNKEAAQMAPIHEHQYVKIQVPGTCMEGGYSLSTCSICGYKYKSDYTSTGDHVWELTETIEPTCEEEGCRKDTCKVCGKERSEKIAPTGHKYGPVTVVVEATCEETGSSVQDCEYCGGIKETEIPALGHDYSEWIEQIKPTCTDDGTRVRQCRRCGKTETEELKATGHSFAHWTTSADGKTTRYCTNCGLVETKGENKKKRPVAILIAAVLVMIVAVIALMLFINRKNNAAEPIEQKEIGLSNEQDVVKGTEGNADDNLVTTEAANDDINVGDIITFGSYEQDNDLSNGKEPIEWIVLAKENENALLISKYALDCQKYNSSNTGITWEKCSLRDWLNGTFLRSAFSADEQAKIATINVSADINEKEFTDPGKATNDKVFLLSIREAKIYFATDESRKCVPTAYAKAQGAETSNRNRTDGGENLCWWWLRSPGFLPIDAAYVGNDGSISHSGFGVNSDRGTVRPALWFALDSSSDFDSFNTLPETIIEKKSYTSKEQVVMKKDEENTEKLPSKESPDKSIYSPSKLDVEMIAANSIKGNTDILDSVIPAQTEYYHFVFKVRCDDSKKNNIRIIVGQPDYTRDIVLYKNVKNGDQLDFEWETGFQITPFFTSMLNVVIEDADSSAVVKTYQMDIDF